jgi:hypothetical protein
MKFKSIILGSKTGKEELKEIDTNVRIKKCKSIMNSMKHLHKKGNDKLTLTIGEKKEPNEFKNLNLSPRLTDNSINSLASVNSISSINSINSFNGFNNKMKKKGPLSILVGSNHAAYFNHHSNLHFLQ